MSDARTAAPPAALTPEVARRPKVALVVGSGGIRCAAAVGLWKVLAREGISVDMVVGCSGGSIYVAAMALGMDVEEAERHTYRMWQGLFERVHVRALARSLLPARFQVIERFGLVHDGAVGRVMQSLYGDATFADTQIPLYIAATDLHRGERFIIESGLVRDAVRASIAIPVLLPPWTIDGRVLVDGGATDPLPASVAIREGADIILAMGFESPTSPQVSSVLGLVGQTAAVATNHLLRATFAFYNAAHHAELVPIVPEFGRSIGLRDVELLPLIVEKGEEAAEAQMPYLRRLLQPPAA